MRNHPAESPKLKRTDRAPTLIASSRPSSAWGSRGRGWTSISRRASRPFGRTWRLVGVASGQTADSCHVGTPQSLRVDPGAGMATVEEPV